MHAAIPQSEDERRSIEMVDVGSDDSQPGGEDGFLSSARHATRGVAKVENEDSMTSEMVRQISPAQRIVSRRGAFRWLPVLCCNDVVHGSWYA